MRSTRKQNSISVKKSFNPCPICSFNLFTATFVSFPRMSSSPSYTRPYPRFPIHFWKFFVAASISLNGILRCCHFFVPGIVYVGFLFLNLLWFDIDYQVLKSCSWLVTALFCKLKCQVNLFIKFTGQLTTKHHIQSSAPGMGHMRCILAIIKIAK